MITKKKESAFYRETLQLAHKMQEIINEEIKDFFMITLKRIPRTEELKKYGEKEILGNTTKYSWKGRPSLLFFMETKISTNELAYVSSEIKVRRLYLEKTTGKWPEARYTVMKGGLLTSSYTASIVTE